MFQAQALDLLEFEDKLSPERVASVSRMRSAGFVLRNDLPRFRWCLNTIARFDSERFDLFTHVAWLLLQLKPSVSLEAARKRGVESFLSLYYAGNGTGSGPHISTDLAALLVRHGISLQVGFYYEDSGAL